MAEHRAVDVISVCSAEGQIHPLRLQMLDENSQLLRVHILEAKRIQLIQHVGAEAEIFQCSAKIHDRLLHFQLKYTYRSHTWHLL